MRGKLPRALNGTKEEEVPVERTCHHAGHDRSVKEGAIGFELQEDLPKEGGTQGGTEGEEEGSSGALLRHDCNRKRAAGCVVLDRGGKRDLHERGRCLVHLEGTKSL